MSTYSLGGYLSALTVRELRTVLVEGKDDKKVIASVMLEYEGAGVRLVRQTVVDSVELVRGDNREMGNRALVELIHQECVRTGLDIEAVVDREFREFAIDSEIRDTLDCHAVRDDTLYWTRGHSIENYFFGADYFSRFIKSHFAEQIGPSCLQSCKESFEIVLSWAAAVGLASWEGRLLTRSLGLAKHTHWQLSADGRVRLDVDAYCSAVRTRGVSSNDVHKLGVRISEFYQMVVRTSTANRRHIAHGHLALELIWCGLAATIRESGASTAAVEGVAYGHTDVKLRSLADLVAQDVCQGRAQLLPDLMQRLYRDLNPAA